MPVAVAVAVALAVVVGALVLLGHRGAQSPSTPASGGPDNAFATLILNTPKAQLRRELTLMSAASRTVLASAACRVSQSRSAPPVHGLPGQELLSTLGALRRPATAADRLPAGSLSAMGPGVAMYAGAARRAATIAGTTYYLVPIRQDPAGGSLLHRLPRPAESGDRKGSPDVSGGFADADPGARGGGDRLRHAPGGQAPGRRDLRGDRPSQRRRVLVQ